MEGFDGIGIELDEKNVKIAQRRIAWAGEQAGNATESDAIIMNKVTQLGLFGDK